MISTRCASFDLHPMDEAGISESHFDFSVFLRDEPLFLVKGNGLPSEELRLTNDLFHPMLSATRVHTRGVFPSAW